MEDEIEPRKDRRVLLLAGGALALVGGLALAAALMIGDKGGSRPPPASQGGLVVQATRPDEDKLDPSRPLRCFVSGQFVGELTLAQCAERNGVATGALDVGLDETGALAAADVAGTVLTPLPPADAQPPVVVSTPADEVPSAAPTQIATCWRFSREGWREVGDMSRGACAQTLFDGQCEAKGDATYGRWGEQTLRLVTGRVEISSDNRRFRTLAEQGPGCSLPTGE